MLTLLNKRCRFHSHTPSTRHLDDFDAGYSALSYLRQLPLEQVKTDRSFASGVTTGDTGAAMAKALVVLWQMPGVEVIAEGIETEEQRDFLASAGCLRYPGHLFNAPVAISQFPSFLK